MRYLKKLNEYANSTEPDSGIGLTDAEKAVLGEFCKVLSKEALGWLNEKWDLCPLLQRASEKMDELSPRKLISKLLARDATEEQPTEYTLFINFEKNRFMKQDWHAEGNITIPNTLTHEWISNDVLRINLDSGVDGIDLSKVVLTGQKPSYEYSSTITSKYDIAGYTLSSKSSTLRFKSDQTVTSVDFGGNSTLTIYAAWNPEYILEFISDNTHYQEGESSGAMNPRKLTSVGNKAPEPEFTSPGETRTKFNYCYCPEDATYKWQEDSVIDGYNSDTMNPNVSLYGFKEWECSIGGIRYVLHEGDPLKINAFNLDCPPVIRMTAYWERAYDVISFLIDGNKYCEVCIDVNVNRVVYPNHAPEIQSTSGEDWKFYGWDYSEGDYLPGVDRSAMVICGDPDHPIVCDNPTEITICGDGDNVICPSSPDTMQNWEVICSATGETYIVCKEDETDYSLPIRAYLVKHELQQFKVTFKYMDVVNNEVTHVEHEEFVNQNQHLPRFHIHNKYVKNGSTFTFKHWLLKSGNLTSSLTVLSVLVFVAIYDETKNIDTHHGESDSPGKGSSTPGDAQSSAPTISEPCNHC